MIIKEKISEATGSQPETRLSALLNFQYFGSSKTLRASCLIWSAQICSSSHRLERGWSKDVESSA